MQEEMESKEMISLWINPNKHWLEKTMQINNVQVTGQKSKTGQT